MLRRTLSVVSSLFVALFLVAASSAKASEIIAVTSVSVLSADGVNPVTVSISAQKSVRTDAYGNINRTIIAGTVSMFGRVGTGIFSVNASITDVKVQDGWAIITMPYTYAGISSTLEVRVLQGGIGVGRVGCRVIDSSSRFIAYPLAPQGSNVYSTYAFTDGSASVSYRRF